MAGNIKEWCSNETQSRGYCLGGSRQDNEDMFNRLDAYDPGRRNEDMGFRCMQPIPGLSEASEADAPLDVCIDLDFSSYKPCSNEAFDAYEGLYAYTKTDLKFRIESQEVLSESRSSRGRSKGSWGARFGQAGQGQAPAHL